MKIYTRTGDDGTTSLAGGERVPKDHIRVEAYGTVDELISWIGLLADHHENYVRKDFLKYLQDQLMRIAATIASDPVKADKGKYLPEPDCVRKIENEIDKTEESLEPLDSFIIPGGNILVSYCHIARCVCRRAERRVIEAGKKVIIPELIIIFLNRLSDYLYVLSRKLNLDLDNEEIRWSI